MTQLILPPTQPVTDSLEDSSPPVDYENPWGRFHPMRINLGHCINLTQDSFTVGRYIGCDYTLTKDEVGEKLYDCISNYQFRVERKEEEGGFFVVLITDLSSNGTFLNGNLIGRCLTSVLSHNDNIAIAKSTNNIFTFVDLSAQVSPYPDEITKNYAIYNLLGKGGYGEVRLVLKKQTTEKFAMKSIHLTPIEEKKIIDVFAEVKVLRQLNHDNIVKLINQFSEEETMYILLEYMPGGDLATFIRERKVLSENVTKFIYYQVLLGVEYLHTNKILHRDLKPANILLSAKTDYPKVKITDFGLSKILVNGQQTEVHTRCGTLTFAPPELQFPNVSRTCDFRVDVWSLGVILYLCLSGVLPFRRDRKDLPLEKQINSASYSMNLDVFKKVSNPPKFIIRRCLQRLPKSRCMVDEIIEDEWFRKDESFQRKLLELSQDINFSDKENATEPPLKKRRV